MSIGMELEVAGETRHLASRKMDSVCDLVAENGEESTYGCKYSEQKVEAF